MKAISTSIQILLVHALAWLLASIAVFFGISGATSSAFSFLLVLIVCYGFLLAGCASAYVGGVLKLILKQGETVDKALSQSSASSSMASTLAFVLAILLAIYFG
jgi:hypothetical protein